MLVIKCLELMVDCDKLKHFKKDLFDSMWNCVQLILNHEVCFEFKDELSKIFEKLAETHQFIFIKRIIGVINESPNIEILKTIFTFTSKIKLKVSTVSSSKHVNIFLFSYILKNHSKIP